MRLRGRDAADRASVTRRATSRHVAAPKSGRRGPNRADLVRIGHIGQYRPMTDAADKAETGRNLPKQAGIGRNRPKSAVKIAGEAEILTSDAFLALFFLCFVNQVY